ncbi:iron-containing redox enzyme family protein [Deinococcus hopiensis]|uniref:Iron-containing redox enzyme n=1 Tax=Deinococcus hopiensis KR-140 TaxID=695939 RepID=A0A1W1U9N2_9DEIO|nr:iron-containing redox enzyme family protein [Deinococcus hopiensis]SMB77752.1 Iron-containing redox enzyme [Deinococcus hopiensis KR-140]
MNERALMDLGYDPKTLTSEQVMERLDQRVQQLVEEVQREEFFQAVTNSNMPVATLREVLKEIYLEISHYQEHIIEASIALIGQMPRSLEVRLIEELLHHQAEEFNHGEMAVSDYVGLGGDEAQARSKRMTPSAFGIAALRRMMVHLRDWPAWLGSLYVVETSTPILSGMVKDSFRARGIPGKGLWFIDHHATADLEHADLLRGVLQEVLDAVPTAKEGMLYGPEYYLQLYPKASWQAAYNRAIRRVNASLEVSSDN